MEHTESTDSPVKQSPKLGGHAKLKLIDIKPGQIQFRGGLDHEAIKGYAEHMLDGAKFEPIVVIKVGPKYEVIDGHHRLAAAKFLKRHEIDAVELAGSHNEIVWFALGANSRHGLRLDRKSVRRAIGIALKAFPHYANNVIARQIGCSDATVESVRTELESTSQITKLDKTLGADGKLRPAKRKRKVPISILSPQMSDIPPAAPASDSTEDSGPVHDSSDITSEADNAPVRDMAAAGLAIATRAIEILETIPSCDPERQSGLALVLDWLETAMTPPCPDVATEGTVPA